MSKGMPKFYHLEGMTQEDLNRLALERNTLARKVEKLEEENKKLKDELNILKQLIPNETKYSYGIR